MDEDSTARATLGQLLLQWGSPPDIDPKKPPQLVCVQMMGREVWWRMVGNPSGKDTPYRRVADASDGLRKLAALAAKAQSDDRLSKSEIESWAERLAKSSADDIND